MLPPKKILHEIGRKWPDTWKHFKHVRTGKGVDLPSWPDWCYIPIAAGFSIAEMYDTIFDSMYGPAVLTAAATWRISQGVYRFDADLYNSLINQDIKGNVPCEALKHIPEWCIYVETINAFFTGDPISGFWAHLESDVNDGRMELRLVLLLEDGCNVPVPVHLGDWTLSEGLQRMQKEADKNSGMNLKKVDFLEDIAPLVQLVLYLCADNADMKYKPAHPSTRARTSGKIDAPKEPRIWNVGERIGTAIRMYRNQQQQDHDEDTINTRRSPRPHIRKSHWHHYWTGPNDGDKKLIVHWMPPIPVMVDDNEDLPAVIHVVKDE